MVRPFARITRSIGDLQDGYDADYLHVYTYKETTLISDAFNQMLGRLKKLDDSRQEFVSNVSHELKTPLTSMKVLSGFSVVCRRKFRWNCTANLWVICQKRS